ncbi:MAG: serine/threonine-protein kinase, partial [Myxococcota bacterium]
TGTLNANCPDCTSMVSASVDAEWVSAAQALPVADMPDVVSRYLSERPRGPTPEPAATGRAATPSSLADRYKIQRRLGAGGMGDVFLARRVGPAGFEKLVVIKRIRADRVEDGDAVDSFLQEARLAARLSHPNIVQIFDLGKISDEYFISMEYVDGLDLRTVLRINEQMNLQMPVAICCRIISDLCQALYDAHSHRDESGELRPIIHRDVSPGNVLLSQSGVAKLTDFGIAKAGDSELETKSGVIKGTMRYIPPEVLRGPRSKTLHPRIDVYGAAILLYECLAGKPLFAGDNWVHTLRSILRQPVPKLSQVREGIAPQLEQTFERAIARDPKRRYQSVKELLDDLEAAIESAGYAVTNNTLSKWVRQMLDHKKNLDADESDPSAAPSAGDDGSDADDLSNSRANTR